jgi:uncharacterized membrane protein
MSNRIRLFHRWISAAFVMSFIATSIALAQKQPVMWMSYLPLAPLALLAVTGIYLFVRPYLARTRRAPGAG